MRQILSFCSWRFFFFFSRRETKQSYKPASTGNQFVRNYAITSIIIIGKFDIMPFERIKHVWVLSINQPISQSINQSVSQLTRQAIHPSIHQSINQSINQSVNQ